MIIVLDVFVCLLLLCVPFVIFELKRRKELSGKQTLLNIIISNKYKLLIHLGIGLFFAFTYIAFRFFHSPWKAFGFLHIYGLFASFIFPFVLAYFCKGTKQAKKVAIVMSALLFLSPITRPIFIPMVRTMNSIASWDMAIPFNLCNISALVFIIAILTKNKTLQNYMITFGLFGGIINNLQAHNTHMPTFWYYLTWESYIVHAFIIIIPIFMLLTNQVKPSLKHTLYNTIWIFAFFLLAGFVINPLWNTNFHFTKPIAFTQAFLPQLSKPLQIFGAAVDPLYMAGMLVLVCAAVTVIYGTNFLTYKYFRPRFSNLNKEEVIFPEIPTKKGNTKNKVA